jgi:phosphate transport system substrate-binding protein
MCLALVLALASVVACTSGHTPEPTPASTAIGAADRAKITGGGATFPATLYQAWFFDYNRHVAPGVQVNYQSIGSGGGIQQFIQGTMEFGATDAPMTDEELARAPDAVHIPTVLGAVVVAYNLRGLDTPLTLDGETLARIYLGEITRWADPAIEALNPGLSLPDAAIQVVHRSDGSGTSFVWTQYLSAVSAGWNSRVGTSKNPNWPVGTGAQGSEGLTNTVRQTPNSIGYVDLNYAIASGLSYASIRNQSGDAIAPTLESVSAAAAGVDVPDDFRVSLVNSDAAEAYPIVSFTYLLLHRETSSCTDQRPLVHALWWVFHDPTARETAASLDFAPLPAALLPEVESALRSLRCNGQPALSEASE